MDRVFVDIWENHIFSRLSDKTIIALSGVCSNLRRMFNKDELWTRLLWSRWIVSNVDAIDIFNLNFSRDTYISLWKQYDVLISKRYKFETSETNDIDIYAYEVMLCNVCEQRHHVISSVDLMDFIPLYLYSYVKKETSYAKLYDGFHPCNLYGLTPERKHISPVSNYHYLNRLDYKKIGFDYKETVDYIDVFRTFTKKLYSTLNPTFIEEARKRIDQYNVQTRLKGAIYKQLQLQQQLEQKRRKRAPKRLKMYSIITSFNKLHQRPKLHQRQNQRPRYGNSRRYCNNYK